MAARLASQASVATPSTTMNASVSRPVVDPGTGSRTVRTHDGVPPGAFFSKKLAWSTPLGYRIRVSGRSRRCGSRTVATRT
jgi:hypothetical protein